MHYTSIHFIWNYELSGVDLRMANCSRNLQSNSISVTENFLILYTLISLLRKLLIRFIYVSNNHSEKHQANLNI